HYEKSLKLREQLVEQVHQDQPSLVQRKRSLAISYIKLGALALALHDPARALGYAQNAVNTSLSLAKAADSKESPDRESIAAAFGTLARAQLLTGQEAAAREAYRQAEQLEREWMRPSRSMPGPGGSSHVPISPLAIWNW